MNQWLDDHMSGRHQEEIVSLMKDIEPHFVGHSRAIILFAMTRTIAGMLAPARKDTRENYLRDLIPMLEAMLAKIDEMMGKRNEEA